MHFRNALVAALVLAVALAAAGEDKTDRDAFQEAQRQLRSHVASQRVEAIERLRDLPTPEAAKLLAPTRLADPDPEVRRAAYETLLTWKDRRDICTYLLKILEKEGHGKKSRSAVVVPLVAVLLASEEPETQRDLHGFLDGYVPAANEGVAAITAVADELARQGDRPALATLERMTRLACFSSTFACRRAVVQAMIQIRLPQAIGVLTELLPGVDGEVRGDVVRHLAAVSGRQYGNQSEAWQRWWKEHKDGFQFPSPTAAAAAARDGAAEGGLLLRPGDRGPADGLRGGHFRQHGGRAIASRQAGTDHGHRRPAARRGLQPGDLQQQGVGLAAKSATGHAGRQAGRPGIRLQPPCRRRHGRLRRLGFRFSVRRGGDLLPLRRRSERGQDRAPAAIVAAVAQANRSRRISLYTIGIAPGRRAARWIGSWRSWRRRILAFIAASISADARSAARAAEELRSPGWRQPQRSPLGLHVLHVLHPLGPLYGRGLVEPLLAPAVRWSMVALRQLGRPPEVPPLVACPLPGGEPPGPGPPWLPPSAEAFCWLACHSARRCSRCCSSSIFWFR